MGLISTISREGLIEQINQSSSIKELLKGLAKVNGGNYKTLKKRLKQENISLSELKNKARDIQNCSIVEFMKKKKFKNEDVFIAHSKLSRGNLKQRIIIDQLIPYVCRDCKNEGTWNDKRLSLQLEHINGINDDYRLENLCFLCPNCHSQTETFAGKNSKQKRVIRNCEKCGKLISSQAKRLCLLCAVKENGEKRRKFNPTKEELIKLIQKEKNLTVVAKKFGVTMNSVKKRCKLLGINYKK
jgi:hypothetical protein